MDLDEKDNQNCLMRISESLRGISGYFTVYVTAYNHKEGLPFLKKISKNKNNSNLILESKKDKKKEKIRSSTLSF